VQTEGNTTETGNMEDFFYYRYDCKKKLVRGNVIGGDKI
jgi:hypothetical protein